MKIFQLTRDGYLHILNSINALLAFERGETVMPTLRQKMTASEFFNALNDKRLSLKDRGVLATLQTMELGSEFSLEGISENIPDSYPVVLRSVRNLEDCGYIDRKGIYGDKGYKIGSEYRLVNDNDRR